jgi:hypothetical protein
LAKTARFAKSRTIVAGAATHVEDRRRRLGSDTDLLLRETVERLAQQDRLHDLLAVARGLQKLGKTPIVVAELPQDQRRVVIGHRHPQDVSPLGL